jgi:hypothetical protein
MTVTEFQADLARANVELVTAIEDVMALVRARKAFGERWKAAVERESKAHKNMHCILNSYLKSTVTDERRP